MITGESLSHGEVHTLQTSTGDKSLATVVWLHSQQCCTLFNNHGMVAQPAVLHVVAWFNHLWHRQQCCKVVICPGLLLGSLPAAAAAVYAWCCCPLHVSAAGGTAALKMPVPLCTVLLFV
jgi:hypothetical protein